MKGLQKVMYRHEAENLALLDGINLNFQGKGNPGQHLNEKQRNKSLT